MVLIATQTLKIATIVVTTFLVVVAGVRFFDYYREQTIAANVGKVVTFRVRQNDDVPIVAKRLQDRGLINSELYFQSRVRLTNADVVPGTYKLRIGMSVAEIIDVLTGEGPQAESSNESPKGEAKEIKLTVIEGWRTEQIAEALVDAGWEGSVEDFMKAVEQYDVSAYDVLKDRNNPENPNSLEGYLFPDTYFVKSDTPAADIIQQMLNNFDAKVTPQMRQRAQEMNLSIYEVLIFASLIEREAQLAEERPLIADVYLNRYVAGWELEADPTVTYAAGKRDGEWWWAPTEQDLAEVDSPYNTYLNAGLPPGPIANPSLDSIQAVLTPAGTANMFFVAKQDGSGEHLFAETNEQHEANKAALGYGAESSSQGGEEVPIESTGG